MPKPTLCKLCNITRASFGLPGGKRTRCAKCKDPDMIDLMSKKCEVCKITTASFGLPGKKRTHYVKCKTDHMINVKEKLCQVCNKTQPFYGIDKEKPATHCSKCKTSEMINVRTKMCLGCNLVNPRYGLPNGKVTHCVTCKTDNMVWIGKTCEKCKKKQPVFGYEGERPQRCAKCKDPNMIDLITKRCIECKKTAASFGYENQEYNYCVKCKKDGMINFKSINRKCKQELCPIRGNEKYEGYCTHCFQHLFPNSPLCLKMNYKTYETWVNNALIENKFDFVHDKPIYHSGCDCSSRRRIDFWKIIGNTILAIEVDENQHSGYDKKDEEIRYDDLFMHFSGKWIFIRFNPNKYKKGNKTCNPKMHERIPVLIEEINTQIERINKESNKELVEIYRLFFNRV